ncbi:MBL fold metallo-hydrolase [Nocardioides endophyticus]|uniref:MBL fold metallo-hydrolase n=1 Tax=Nocardioides endophyticus TaxID=1353775 RepID=A0ABP8Z545_9ACTN
MGLTLTHIGGPTVLVELDGWRILTDPTFDPPGRTYGFALGTSSTKTAGPALTPVELGPVDAVLLSHDHHADNLDDSGRALLTDVSAVITTVPGARRINLPGTTGLRAGGTHILRASGKPDLTVTATPCRHGPPLSRAVVGSVIGFALSLDETEQVQLWITGDTVLHRAVRTFASSHRMDVVLMHLGRVRFSLTGPLRYSMDSRDGLELLELARPRRAVPVHFEGWSHFSELEKGARSRLTPDSTGDIVQWLEPGIPTPV